MFVVSCVLRFLEIPEFCPWPTWWRSTTTSPFLYNWMSYLLFIQNGVLFQRFSSRTAQRIYIFLLLHSCRLRRIRTKKMWKSTKRTFARTVDMKSYDQRLSMSVFILSCPHQPTRGCPWWSLFCHALTEQPEIVREGLYSVMPSPTNPRLSVRDFNVVPLPINPRLSVRDFV